MLLSLPPHTSGKLQPLDKAVYKSLKSNFNIACNDWMVMNPGKTITIYEIAGLLGIAFPKAFTPANIINLFRSTRIWPLNRNIFSDEDFLSSSVTDRPLENVLPIEELPQLPAQRSPVSSTSRQSPIHQNSKTFSKTFSLEFSVTTHQSLTVKPTISTSRFIPLVEVRPYPKASARKEVRQNNRKKRSQILTDTPIKDQIIEEIKLSKAKSVERNVLKG
ncbi:hypothetical protein NQ314_002661 [Rhamnusium bicolor]|uniref:Uncharacterized protein n=1 Tax=Rhamnusium bicolor TaxID=1586634 RepID=A0AAV8ZQW0_9CUCU|nr:hypothetical protein NQ314_002661 [Rhamnusium bicolor]